MGAKLLKIGYFKKIYYICLNVLIFSNKNRKVIKLRHRMSWLDSLKKEHIFVIYFLILI